jgi:hypothetical protein
VLLICHFVRGCCVEYRVCVLFLSYFLLLKHLLSDTYVVVVVVFGSCLCVRYKSWKFLNDIAVFYVTKFISLCFVYWILLPPYCSMFVVCGRIRCNLVRLNFPLLICFDLFWIWWIILFAFSIWMQLLKRLMCDWSCCRFSVYLWVSFWLRYLIELEFNAFLRLSLFILSSLALFFDWNTHCFEYDGKFLNISECKLNVPKPS